MDLNLRIVWVAISVSSKNYYILSLISIKRPISKHKTTVAITIPPTPIKCVFNYRWPTRART